MAEQKLNPELINAVADLYNRKIIKKDKDIADLTGYSKGTVSGYINGNVKASDEFIREFENKFGLRLMDYAAYPRNSAPPATIQLSWQQYLTLIHSSLEALKAGQNEILDQQAMTRAEVRGYGKYHLMKDSKGKNEKYEELVRIVDKLVNDELGDDEDTPQVV